MDIFSIVVGCFTILNTIITLFTLSKVNNIEKRSQNIEGDHNFQVGGDYNGRI